MTKEFLTLNKPVFPGYLNTLLDACMCIRGEVDGEIGGSPNERKVRTLDDALMGMEMVLIPSWFIV